MRLWLSGIEITNRIQTSYDAISGVIPAHHAQMERRLEAAGVQTVIHISVRGRLLTIDPEALLLAHQLHLKTEIVFRT